MMSPQVDATQPPYGKGIACCKTVAHSKIPLGSATEIGGGITEARTAAARTGTGKGTYRRSWLSMTFLTIAITLLLLSWLDYGEAVPVHADENTFESRHYCSQGLEQAINMICGGRTNSLANQFPDSINSSRPHRVKRSSDDVFYRPSNSGASHQCCQRPCGYPELRMYCAV